MIFECISDTTIAGTRLTEDSTVIGTAINFEHLLVQEPKDDGRLALIRDSGKRSVIALHLFTRISKLPKLI